MADEKHPDLKRRLAGTPPDPTPAEEPERRRTPTDDDLRPNARGGRLDPEAVARWWARWTKYMVPALLATALALAAGIPTVISVYRDGMTKLAAKADKAQGQADKAKEEGDAVYVKVTKPQLEDLKRRLAELEADKARAAVPKRVGQRRRPVPVAPVAKAAPLPQTPAAVLQAPAPALPPPLKPDAGQ